MMDGMRMEPGLMVWTWITFGGLLLLLSRYAFKPLREAMEERERRIRDSLDQAHQAQTQAEELVKQNELRLGEAREETRRLINEGHKVVAQMRTEADDRGRREAEALVNQARLEIERETRRSLDELKQTVANLSVHIARQVIQEDLDETRHHRMADEFVERLKKTHARSA